MTELDDNAETARLPAEPASSSGTLSGQEDNRPIIELAPGTMIGGVYTIIRPIGRGGMGEVYLARHNTLGKKCALKIISPDRVTDEAWQRFQLEARALSQLEHLNLVKVTDLGVHQDCLPFYAMDYIEGKSLADIVADTGPMPLDAVLDIFMQVCDGIGCAHRNGMLHRDIKPANILVAQAANQKRVAKVLDFGLVKLIGNNRTEQSLTAVGDIFGSPNYMSPEQCNYLELDERSDIYSLGCTMFECLTGRPPFSSNLTAAVFFSHMEATPPSLASIAGPGVFPQSLEEVMTKLLRKSPDDRYQTLVELRGDLEKISRPAAQAYPPTRRYPKSTNPSVVDGAVSAKRPLRFLFIAGAALIAGACGLVLLCGRAVHNDPSPVLPTAAVTVKSERTSLSAVQPPVRDLANPQLPPHQIVTASLMLSRPFSTDVQEGGKSFRSYDFPTDVAIGLIGTTDNEKAYTARGHLKLAADKSTIFVPAEIVGRYPNCLKRFRPGEVSGVKFLPDADEKIFKAVTKFYNLYVLDFRLCRGLSASSVAPLTCFRRLTVLLGSNNNIEGLALAKAQCLDQLEELYLTSNQNAELLLRSLNTNMHLKNFGMWGKISRKDIEAIAGLSQLTDLDLNGDSVSNSDIAVLSVLSKLTDLNVRRTQVDAGCIEALKKLKALKVLQIKSPKMKPDDFDMIKKSLPGVDVT